MIVRRIDESADDFTCRGVLEVLERLAANLEVPTPQRPTFEPTGITYTVEMAPYIERRADERGAA